MVKQLRQLAGVDQVKVTDFKKGVFAITPKKGAELSEAALRDAIKRSGFTTEKIVTPKGVSAKKPRAAVPTRKKAEEAAASKDSEQWFAPARETFRQGDYREALRLARRAAQEKPRDSRVHQLVALTHFALGEYGDSASAAHTALHLGEQWDWKELSHFYSDTQDYSAQLKKLEQYARENPSSAQAHFLLGYHYLMRGDSKAARNQLALAAKLDPEDELVAELLKQLDKGREGRDQ